MRVERKETRLSVALHDYNLYLLLYSTHNTFRCFCKVKANLYANMCFVF